MNHRKFLMKIKVTRKLVFWLIEVSTKLKRYLEEKYSITDYNSLEYFFNQSANYPYWWRKYEWWGYRNNQKNPIYLHRFYGTNSSPEGISREQKPDSVAGRVQD